MSVSMQTTEIKCWKNEAMMDTVMAGYKLKHHSFPKHFHDHYVIELVVKGADKFYCNGKIHTASPHEIVFINPGEIHTGSTIAENELHYYSISPTKKQLQQIALLLEKNIPSDFCFEQTLTNSPQIAEKMFALFCRIENSGVNDLKAEELFLEFMNQALDSITPKSEEGFADKKDKRVLQVIDFIRNSFDEQISLQQMAKHVHVSPFHLLRIFKAATGLSPYEYLLIVRMEQAKRLLSKGGTVHDAALSTGFYDTSHFNRIFKKVNGASPKNFRLSK